MYVHVYIYICTYDNYMHFKVLYVCIIESDMHPHVHVARYTNNIETCMYVCIYIRT